MANNFDFPSEMVYNKKHLNKVSFEKDKYNLVEIVEHLYNMPLNDLHNNSNIVYPMLGPDMLGRDSHTEFHNLFYSKLDSGWNELSCVYNAFISEVVLPYLNLDEALVQVYPNLRIHLPNNVAIVIKHYDSDELHKHPKGEINFIYALTDMYDTNTLWVEKMPRLEEYEPLTLKAGECISFNANLCNHFNKKNETGKTRVSFDFRVLPLNYYNPNNSEETLTKKMKYVEGEYYKRVFSKKIPKIGIKSETETEIFSDIWNKEKDKFKSIMSQYNVSNSWDIVDLFEKKIAEYSGSKYAVSLDNCTNAIFLCLKYLDYTGEVTIPSRTYCSVPCSILNAGCKVKFEDVEWSGVYQLKPTPIYDGAVRFKKGMYKPNTYHCLSFHIRKHIPIGKGGMILTDDYNAYKWFQLARYSGRHTADNILYKDDTFDMIGWNMYMTPEQAARGLELFSKIGDDNVDQESSGSCKDLSKYLIYTKK